MSNCEIEKMLSEREDTLTREFNAGLELACFDARKTILDVGTGSGRMLLQIVKHGYSVVSGDINTEALDKARERLGDLADTTTLEIMDAHKMQFEDNSFHAITLANAIHEMDDVRDALAEIIRVLTADGKLLVVEFNSQGFELMELHHRAEGRGSHRKGEMSTEEINQYLRSSFDHVETREFSITHAWVASGKKRGNNN
jgi:ubiquinone/menaquinone biosynthesis C-methylase UbiE